jgi:hypothetical protein
MLEKKSKRDAIGRYVEWNSRVRMDWRVSRLVGILDAGQSTTLVSGKDGFIYMANNSAEYDISAPWGGLKVKENIFSYDVFGRLIWFNAKHVRGGGYMTDMGVACAESMPKDMRQRKLSPE